MAKKKTSRKRVPTDEQLAKIEKSRDLPIVRVTWNDATSSRGAGDLRRIRETVYCMESKSVGYLVRNDRTFVSIGRDAFHDGHLTQILTIPRVWVTKIELLDAV